MNHHRILTPICLIAVATFFQGCEKKDAAKPDAKLATPVTAPAATSAAETPAASATPSPASALAKPAEATKPVRVGATSEEDFDPATDIVLGWWKSTFDPFDDTKVSQLWPTNSDDTRSLKVIRFLNDSMATNGCCAGAEWSFVAPKFYKVDREIHELYYLPDDNNLYFLARVDAKDSGANFKKIVAAVQAGKSVEDLVKAKLIEAPAKFARYQPR